MATGTGEEDFYAALVAIGGCTHIPALAPQSLENICKECRQAITKLVLLRDHYRMDGEFFK